ncbi:MAG: aminotransferase class IV [Deltaproteobacteria bacterium]|nr:aminotransferase class IV [Deltaproteobacteria bacterium]
MTNGRIAYFNGEYVPWERATVHLMSHSLGRGSAIFEVLSVHETDTGPAVFRLDEHLIRLARTAKMLDMELPLTIKDLQHAVIRTATENGFAQGFIKIIGYYPQVSFNILPPRKKIDIAVFTVDPGNTEMPPSRGATACISRWRKLDPGTVPVEAKVAANYLNGMMARQDAASRRYDYAIMLDVEGNLAEGGTESLFIVRKGALSTPALGNILDSITRRSLLEVAHAHGIPTMEEPIPYRALQEADEIFFSGTPVKVVPVKKIESRELTNVPGPVTARITGLMEHVVAGRDRRFTKWLFPIRF